MGVVVWSHGKHSHTLRIWGVLETFYQCFSSSSYTLFEGIYQGGNNKKFAWERQVIYNVETN